MALPIIGKLLGHTRSMPPLPTGMKLPPRLIFSTGQIPTA
jgi:hypothetical protein